jgi:hypothetical protein
LIISITDSTVFSKEISLKSESEFTIMSINNFSSTHRKEFLNIIVLYYVVA